MKSLLICPSRRPAIPHLSAFGPLATTPIFGDCLVGHWVEHLAAMGAREIHIVAAEGADKVSAAVGDGARWGVRLTVVTAKAEPARDEARELYRPKGEAGWLPAPYDIVPMDHLPGCPDLPLLESYASWFAALLAWMPLAITPSRVRVAQARPGIWIGSRSSVSPRAELFAPCWVGDQACIEAGAVIGPGVIVEDRAIVAGKAGVSQCWIGPDTFVGPMTAVAHSLAWGSRLINWQTDSSLHVPDPFLLSSLTGLKSLEATDRFGRALGANGRSLPQESLITALRARVVHASEANSSG
jgi:hypothetical protein